MKNILLKSALVFGLSAACALADEAKDLNRWFVRPEAGYLAFGKSKYTGQASYGVMTGALLDDEGANELALEWTYSNIKYTDAPAAGVVGGATTRLKGHLEPLLLDYRYRFEIADTVRIGVGPDLGVSLTRGDMTYSTPAMANGEFTGSQSKTAFTYGAGVACEWSVASSLGVQLGYRYLHANKLGEITGTRSADSVVETATFGSFDTHLIYAGLTVSF